MSEDFRNIAIGFVGGGNVARAIAIPLIKRGIVNPRNVWVSAKSDATLYIWKRIDEENPVNTSSNNLEVLLSSKIIFMSIEPRYFDNTIQQAFNTKNILDSIFVSIIAGVTLDELKNNSNAMRHRNMKLIRAIPNMPVRVSQGIILYCRPTYVHPKDAQIVVELLAQIGKVEEIPESLINAAVGLVESGPAFMYVIAEALADGAVKNGVPRELAIKCAAQVLIGAGSMILDTGDHPGQLKDEVCLPAGMTMAGMHQLEAGSVRASFINAVDAATMR